MIVNFKIYKINENINKLVQTSILLIKKKNSGTKLANAYSAVKLLTMH